MLHSSHFWSKSKFVWLNNEFPEKRFHQIGIYKFVCHPAPLPLRDNTDLCLHFISLIFLPTHQARSSVKKRAISTGFSREQQILRSKHFFIISWLLLHVKRIADYSSEGFPSLLWQLNERERTVVTLFQPLEGWPSVLRLKRNGCISGSATWISSTEQSLFMISQWRTWSPDLGDLRTFP